LSLGAFLLVAAQPSQAKVPPYRGKSEPLSEAQRAQLTGPYWKPKCPVPLSQLRLLTVAHWGFDGTRRIGQLVVNQDVAASLRQVFRRLYQLRFPIRHLRFSDVYGPTRLRPPEGDVSGSFYCREAVPSPCSGGSGTGSWSQHAYGRAVDLNPIENPYYGTGCGRVYDPKSRRFVDRTQLRRGMVTPEVVRAFRSIGWGWGGDWTGGTKDYMHFSASGG
jgi:hypothetical protein